MTEKSKDELRKQLELIKERENFLAKSKATLFEKEEQLSLREKQLVQNEEKLEVTRSSICHAPSFRHVVIDSRNIGLDNPGTSTYRYQLIEPIQGVTQLMLVNISIPEMVFNVYGDATIQYESDNGEQKTIKVPLGRYSDIDTLLRKIAESGLSLTLDPLKQTIVVPEGVKIKDSPFWKRQLGGGVHPPDLRPQEYIRFFLENLAPEEEVCRISPKNFTPIQIDLSDPVTLDGLTVAFRDEDGHLVDFQSRHHIVELRVTCSTNNNNHSIKNQAEMPTPQPH